MRAESAGMESLHLHAQAGEGILKLVERARRHLGNVVVRQQAETNY
jgi:hypothetical protein